MSSENVLPRTLGCLKLMTYFRLNYRNGYPLERKSNRKLVNCIPRRRNAPQIAFHL